MNLKQLVSNAIDIIRTFGNQEKESSSCVQLACNRVDNYYDDLVCVCLDEVR